MRSAGTHALVGRPVDPPVAALLTQAGADPERFAARELSAADVSTADLVLALAREHRTAAVELAPSSVRRAFTLRELARILGSVDPAELSGTDVSERLRAAVALAGSRRHRSSPAQDDVDDPYRGSPEEHRRAFGQISGAVDTMADVLVRGTRPQPLG